MIELPSLPRLPLISDPLRRIETPSDLDAVTTRGVEVDPAEVDLDPERVERIWRDAVAWYRSGVHPAVQICVRRHGEIVLDRAIGHARGNGPNDGPETEKVAATPDTPFLIYSTSKAITAFVVHLLHERGALDIHQPVCQYIPDYGCHDKEGITIGHVLSHRAGVPRLPPEVLDIEHVADREFILAKLCEARPFARPGRVLAYHAASGGFILGEIVERVTGKDIRTVLAEEILAPLEFRWTNYGVDEEDLDTVALDYVTGPRTAPPLSMLLKRVLGLPSDQLIAAANDPIFRTAIVPAANVVSTARELSRFFELMRRGGELDGVRVMQPETILRALTEQSHLEIDLSLGLPIRFGYGLMLGARLLSVYGRDTQYAFGHVGYSNTVAWADPERALSCAVCTNGKPVLYPELLRFLLLLQRITDSAPKVNSAQMALSQ